MQITKQEAFNRIMEEHSKIFSVTFIKKDGSIRDMVCRRGVTKGVKGIGMSYDPAAYNLVTVYDMQAAASGDNGYRTIPLDRLKRLKMDGIDCEVI